MIDKEKAVSIDFINKLANRALQDNSVLIDPTIKGEVSGLAIRKGHAYFVLKEPGAQISCNMWSRNLNKAPSFKDGMEVYVRGSLGIYSPFGKYALNVDELKPTEKAMGKMAKILEERFKNLKAEGLFDPEHKKAIPKFPKRLAIISSDSAAGYGDLLDQIVEKNKFIDIELYPVYVQGVNAVATITKALQKANQRGLADLIILARGGGAKEDLMAFNEEEIARAIFASQIPVITAIGHQKDSSIADYVADARAITPTASAQFIPDIEEIKKELKQNLKGLENNVEKTFLLAEQKVESLRHKLENLNPLNIIQKGFGAVLDSSRRQIMSIKELKIHDKIEVVLRDGSIEGRVDKLNEKDQLIEVKKQKGE